MARENAELGTSQHFHKLLTQQLAAVQNVYSLHRNLTESLSNIGILYPDQAAQMWPEHFSSQELAVAPAPISPQAIIAQMPPASTQKAFSGNGNPDEGRGNDLRRSFEKYKNRRATPQRMQTFPPLGSFTPVTNSLASWNDDQPLSTPLLGASMAQNLPQLASNNTSIGSGNEACLSNCVRPAFSQSHSLAKSKPLAQGKAKDADQKKVTLDEDIRSSAGSDASKEGPPGVEKKLERIKRRMSKQKENVEDMYKSEGRAQAVARSAYFQNSFLVVIVFNVIWIAIDTDFNKAEVLCNAPLLFQIVNNLFCVAFSFEIGVRFLAFANTCDAVTEPWFVFDATLVTFMVWETWVEVLMYIFFGNSMGLGGATNVLRIFRMFRLTRVARLARVLRNAPELMILIKGMVIATRSVVATLCLLLIIIYVFAVLLTQQLSGQEGAEGSFDTVPQSMNTLLLNGVFTEEREFIERMLEINWTYYVITIAYLLLASLTVLNMLIGVLCEVVTDTARSEKEETLLQDIEHKITNLLGPTFEEELHKEGGCRVSRATFEGLMKEGKAGKVLTNLGIDLDDENPEECADFLFDIFGKSKDLEFEKFMKYILQLRGSNNATVKDIVDTRRFLCKEINELTSARKLSMTST